MGFLFSSDLSVSAQRLRDYYALGFQIAFSFGDAKQHFGLEDGMGVTQTAVAHAIEVCLFLVNLSSYLPGHLRTRKARAGIQDLKGFYRGEHSVGEVLKMLPDRPDAI